MSGMTKYAMKDGDNLVGKRAENFVPEIAIKGSGIS